MASPCSLGSSLSSSYGPGSLGAQSTRPSIETTIDRCWQFDHGQHKTKCRQDAVEYLEERLRALAKSREPEDGDGAMRRDTIDRLQALLRTIFPPPSQLKLVPYGSFLSSCYSRGSDLDLALSGVVDERLLVDDPSAVLMVPRNRSSPVLLDKLSDEQWVRLLRRLADSLEQQGMTHGPVTRILEARVPIIKFIESRSGIECDICVTTRGCDFKGAVMRELHCLQPDLAPLIRLVKLWAKHHDINSAHCGTLNSWSLALMVLFSMQSFPEGGPLLPPLWRLFHDEEPSGPGGAGRPLQDKSIQLDVMLAAARKRCSPEHAARLLHPRKDPDAAGTPPAGQLKLLLWFLSSFTAITGQWRDNAMHRNWRVSPWLGRGYTGRFPKAYVAAVEEPFDSNDNTARSVGIRERNENTLPYIAWVFGHSVHLLRNVQDTKDASRALFWLFGTDALPFLGLPELRLPPSAVPSELMRLIKRMAEAGQAGKGRRASAPGGRLTGRGSGGSGGGGEGGQQQQQQQDEGDEEDERDREAMAERRQAAFRALIDATRVGSPITSLEEWRHHHLSNRSKPPHGWHRLAPLPPPGPAAPGRPANGAAAGNHHLNHLNGHGNNGNINNNHNHPMHSAPRQLPPPPPGQQHAPPPPPPPPQYWHLPGDPGGPPHHPQQHQQQNPHGLPPSHQHPPFGLSGPSGPFGPSGQLPPGPQGPHQQGPQLAGPGPQQQQQQTYNNGGLMGPPSAGPQQQLPQGPQFPGQQPLPSQQQQQQPDMQALEHLQLLRLQLLYQQQQQQQQQQQGLSAGPLEHLQQLRQQIRNLQQDQQQQQVSLLELQLLQRLASQQQAEGAAAAGAAGAGGALQPNGPLGQLLQQQQQQQMSTSMSQAAGRMQNAQMQQQQMALGSSGMPPGFSKPPTGGVGGLGQGPPLPAAAPGSDPRSTGGAFTLFGTASNGADGAAGGAGLGAAGGFGHLASGGSDVRQLVAALQGGAPVGGASSGGGGGSGATAAAPPPLLQGPPSANQAAGYQAAGLPWGAGGSAGQALLAALRAGPAGQNATAAAERADAARQAAAATLARMGLGPALAPGGVGNGGNGSGGAAAQGALVLQQQDQQQQQQPGAGGFGLGLFGTLDGRVGGGGAMQQQQQPAHLRPQGSGGYPGLPPQQSQSLLQPQQSQHHLQQATESHASAASADLSDPEDLQRMYELLGVTKLSLYGEDAVSEQQQQKQQQQAQPSQQHQQSLGSMAVSGLAQGSGGSAAAPSIIRASLPPYQPPLGANGLGGQSTSSFQGGGTWGPLGGGGGGGAGGSLLSYGSLSDATISSGAGGASAAGGGGSGSSSSGLGGGGSGGVGGLWGLDLGLSGAAAAAASSSSSSARLAVGGGGLGGPSPSSSLSVALTAPAQIPLHQPLPPQQQQGKPDPIGPPHLTSHPGGRPAPPPGFASLASPAPAPGHAAQAQAGGPTQAGAPGPAAAAGGGPWAGGGGPVGRLFPQQFPEGQQQAPLQQQQQAPPQGQANGAWPAGFNPFPWQR